MRSFLALALLGIATHARAQGLIAGVVLDSATRSPLPCVDVALEDTSGRAGAHVLTAPDGVFQLQSPERGVYRLRFSIWHHPPVYSPAETLDPSTDRAQQYVLAFGYPLSSSSRPPADTAADAPPWAERTSRGPRYPTDLRDRGVNGGVLMRFVVDTLGRVDRASIHVVRSTGAGFTTAVQEFLRSARFTPARREHRSVCALVVEPFLFQVTR